MANEKISQLPELITPTLSDLFVTVNGGATKKILNSTLAASFQAMALSPFDAVVDNLGVFPGHYVTISAAIAAGKSYIYKTAGTVEERISITRDVYICYKSTSYILSNQKGFDISANCSLTIVAGGLNNPSQSPNGATILTSGSTEFFSGNGTYSVAGIYFIKGSNASIASSSCKGFVNKCQAQTLGNNNNFFNLQAPGSSITDSYIYAQAFGENVDNSLIVGSGCTGENIYYFNSSGSSGTHITVQAGGRLSGVTGSGQTGGGGFTLKILNQGYLERVFTSYPISPVIINDGGTLANTNLIEATGFAPAPATLTNINTAWRVNNVKFTNVYLENDATSTNGVYLESSTTGGSYSDLGANTRGYGNSGLLPSVSSLAAKKSAAVTFSVTSGVVTVIATRNIDSVVRNTTGEYDFNITSGTFANGNYIVMGADSAQAGVGISGGWSLFGAGASKTATLCQIYTYINGSSNYDPPLATFYFIEV